MIESFVVSLATYFTQVKDPRAQHRIEHQLIDILIITICAVICGANSWVDIENYGLSKQQWLKTFLYLPNGIPSHDTFERLFARLNPEELQQCFLNWVKAVNQITAGQVVAIDGKTLRAAYECDRQKSMIHMISAWATKNRLVLAQKKVDEKSNEITAIPELLKVLELKDALVTIDAMGCQKKIAQQIIQQQGNYVLALKRNQGNLYEDVVQLFELARSLEFKDIEHQYHQTTERGHGRFEIRRYWLMGQTEYLVDSYEWVGLNSIGCVESKRYHNSQATTQRRYYILSISLNVSQFADAVRSHWGIENQLHWVLDVAFDEDRIRCCQGHSGENLAVIRPDRCEFVISRKNGSGWNSC